MNIDDEIRAIEEEQVCLALRIKAVRDYQTREKEKQQKVKR